VAMTLPISVRQAQAYIGQIGVRPGEVWTLVDCPPHK
jgi:hypothetical protein